MTDWKEIASYVVILIIVLIAAQHLNVVVSGSMEPAFYRGDIVLIEKADFFGIHEFNVDDVGVGDVVVGIGRHGLHISGQRVTDAGNQHPCGRLDGDLGIHHHIIRVHIVHIDVFVVESLGQRRLTNDIGGAARLLAGEEGRGGHGTGVEVVGSDLQAHPLQLHTQLLRGLFRAVGEEDELLVVLKKPADEFVNTGQDLVAVIDHAVHVADKAIFFQNVFHNTPYFAKSMNLAASSFS